MRFAAACATALLALSVTACEDETPSEPVLEGVDPASRTGGDAQGPQQKADTDVAAEAGIGTPREDRVATLGILNKRNNISEDIELSPGESRRVGDVIVRLATCEKTAPWEMRQETGAFVQVFVNARNQDQWPRIFSGWLFKNSPSVNVVEHPIYDVWVKDCAMDFPNEEGPVESDPSEDSADSDA